MTTTLHCDVRVCTSQDTALTTQSSDRGPVITITINGYDQVFTVSHVGQMSPALYADLYAIILSINLMLPINLMVCMYALLACVMLHQCLSCQVLVSM